MEFHRTFFLVIFLSLFVAGAFPCLAGAQQNTKQNSPYLVTSVEVMLPASSHKNLRTKAMSQAAKVGFEILLKRLTPRTSWVHHGAVSQAVDWDTVVEKFSIVNEQTTPKYKLIVDISYSKNAVQKSLTDLNIPYSESINGNILLIPLFETDNYLELWGSSNIWKLALEQQIKKHEFTHFILPEGTLEETSLLTPEMANFGAGDVILGLAKKYNASAAVVLRSRINHNVYGGKNITVESQWYGKDKLTPVMLNLPYSATANINFALEETAGETLAAISEKWQNLKLVRVDKPNRVFLRFAPRNAADLENLKTIVKSLPITRSFRLRVLNVKDSVFQVDFYGDPNKMRHYLTNAGLFFKGNATGMVWEVSFQPLEVAPLIVEPVVYDENKIMQPSQLLQE